MESQFRTACESGKAGQWPAVVLLALLALPAAADPTPPWPPFLPARQSYTPDIRLAVERTWLHATFQRTVQGRPAQVPFPLYAALVDAPDVTAAAARFRGFARHEVRAVGEDRYQAEDGAGARGSYQVLRRDPARRVLLSRGEHSSAFLGTVRGSALTLIDLEARGAEVDAHLTAYVNIENPLAAALARVLIAVFGSLADQRLKEGLEIAARVAEWAVTEPDGFCGWLDQASAAPERRLRIAAVLPCARQATRAADRLDATLAETPRGR